MKKRRGNLLTLPNCPQAHYTEHKEKKTKQNRFSHKNQLDCVRLSSTPRNDLSVLKFIERNNDDDAITEAIIKNADCSLMRKDSLNITGKSEKLSLSLFQEIKADDFRSKCKKNNNSKELKYSEQVQFIPFNSFVWIIIRLGQLKRYVPSYSFSVNCQLKSYDDALCIHVFKN